MLLLALFIELIGGTFAWLGLKGLYETWVRRRTWLAVEGSVTGLSEEISRSKNRSITVYAPRYRYLFEGKKHTGVSDLYSSRKRHRVGEQIRLFVNPVSPGESTVIDVATWLFSLAAFLLGLVPMALGAFMAFETLFGTGKS